MIRLLVFMRGYENPETNDTGILSVTYGGRALIRVVGDNVISDNGFTTRLEYWYLHETGIAAAKGTTLSVTYGNEVPADEHFAAATFKNADQSAPLATSATTAQPTVTTTDPTTRTGSPLASAAAAYRTPIPMAPAR